MGSWRRFFDPRWWLYWTVGGIGVKDAYRGFPTEQQCREVETYKRDLERLVSALRTLSRSDAGPAGESHAAAGASATPSVAAQVDVSDAGPEGRRRVSVDGDAREGRDLDDVQRATDLLTRVLERRGVTLDPDDSASESLVRELAAIVGRANRGPRTDEERPEASEERLTHFEAGLVEIAEEKIDRLFERWERDKNILEAQANLIYHQLHERLAAFRTASFDHVRKGGREPHRLIGRVPYGGFLIAVGILEAPINFEAFNILELPTWERYLIAAAPCLGIPFLAHFIGIMLRQWSGTRSKWMDLLLVIAAVTSLLAGLCGIAFLRAEYIAQMQLLASGGLLPVPVAGQINYPDALALLAINFLFLSAGLCASYVAHDPDGELERICKQKQRIRKTLDRIWREWCDVASSFDEKRGVLTARVQEVRDDTMAKLDEYRSFNSCTPSTHPRPTSFGNSISDRFFRPRVVAGELDRHPGRLDELLDRIEEEAASLPAGASIRQADMSP